MSADADHEGEVALFPSQKSNRMSGKGISDVVKRLASRAEVQPYTYAGHGSASDASAHTLRHTVAWRMLRYDDGIPSMTSATGSGTRRFSRPNASTTTSRPSERAIHASIVRNSVVPKAKICARFLFHCIGQNRDERSSCRFADSTMN